jgi:uncharacterized protein YjbI with pentapeptide repeats
MSRWAAGLIIAVTMAPASLSAQDSTAMPMMGPPRLVVFNLTFYGRGANSLEPGDAELAGTATGVLRKELKRYADFQLVDSSLTLEAFAHAETAGPCNTLSCARQVARGLGAQWVATGRLSKTSNLIWYLFGNLVEVGSGKLLTDQELELKGRSREIVPQGAAILSRRLAQAAGAVPLPPLDTTMQASAQVAFTAEAVRARLAAVSGSEIPDFSGQDLSRLDLHGLDFHQANLTKAKLAGANFSNANLFACDLTDAVAAGADFQHANMDGTTLRRTDLQQANLHGASLFATIMESADLGGADLGETRIIGYLKNAKLVGARLVNANIGADPGNQSMGVMRAQFVGADLSGADFTGSNLYKADFSYARLVGTVLAGTDLRNTDLTEADLTKADVTGADVTAANLNGAIFTGARGVANLKGLEKAQNKDKAIFDEPH